jgi:hypothetical protein
MDDIQKVLTGEGSPMEGLEGSFALVRICLHD